MCRSGCPTQNCESYGACLKNANIRIAYCQSAAGKDYTAQKKWDADLDSYADARKEGLEPAGTKRHQVEQARSIADTHGVAAKALA